MTQSHQTARPKMPTPPSGRDRTGTTSENTFSDPCFCQEEGSPSATTTSTLPQRSAAVKQSPNHPLGIDPWRWLGFTGLLVICLAMVATGAGAEALQLFPSAMMTMSLRKKD